MSSLVSGAKVLGYAIVVGSCIYTASTVLANNEIQEVAFRALTSSPTLGAIGGAFSCGLIGAFIGYRLGDDHTGKGTIKPNGSALIFGMIGAVGGAVAGAFLLTSYRHISVQVV